MLELSSVDRGHASAAGAIAGAIIRAMTLTKKPESRPAPNSWGLATGENPWEYAPAPEATDHVRIEPEYGLFIGNEFVPSKPRKTFTVINPATEEPLA